MFGLGTTEMVIILLVVLLVFGAKRIPEIAKSLSQSFKEVRKIGDET